MLVPGGIATTECEALAKPATAKQPVANEFAYARWPHEQSNNTMKPKTKFRTKGTLRIYQPGK